jgi:hypothetical protein
MKQIPLYCLYYIAVHIKLLKQVCKCDLTRAQRLLRFHVSWYPHSAFLPVVTSGEALYHCNGSLHVVLII